MPSLVGSLIFTMYFRYFVEYINSKKKNLPLHLNKFESTSPNHALCQIWLKLAHCMVLERKMKMWKFYGLTDDGQQEIRKAHLRSGEVKNRCIN